ncbi:hypothetical protein L1887_23189 [Cichorium endivia]|nr:hypothetical protein L1887_23189 [Cichorium endivia]
MSTEASISLEDWLKHHSFRDGSDGQGYRFIYLEVEVPKVIVFLCIRDKDVYYNDIHADAVILVIFHCVCEYEMLRDMRKTFRR